METYQINYVCSNCGHHFVEKIERGEKKPIKATCPHCGCFSGEAGYKPRPSIDYRTTFLNN